MSMNVKQTSLCVMMMRIVQTLRVAMSACVMKDTQEMENIVLVS